MTALVIAVAARGATYVSIPRRLAVFAPFGIGMFAAIALNSTRRALTGAGFAWRGPHLSGEERRDMTSGDTTETTPRVTMEEVTALAKRRGFIFQSSEIYGGIGGFFDYGPLGAILKRNVKDAWWRETV